MVVMMGGLLSPAVLAVRVLFAALGRLKPVVVVVVVGRRRDEDAPAPAARLDDEGPAEARGHLSRRRHELQQRHRHVCGLAVAAPRHHRRLPVDRFIDSSIYPYIHSFIHSFIIRSDDFSEIGKFVPMMSSDPPFPPARTTMDINMISFRDGC